MARPTPPPDRFDPPLRPQSKNSLAANALLLCLLSACLASWLLGLVSLKYAAGVFFLALAVLAALAFVHATSTKKPEDPT